MFSEYRSQFYQQMGDRTSCMISIGSRCSRNTNYGSHNPTDRFDAYQQRPVRRCFPPRTYFHAIDCSSAKIYDEKGHRGMVLSFYLTGKERSGVVGVKVQKVVSSRLFPIDNDRLFRFRISPINSSMIIFSFNSIDRGEVEISFKFIKILTSPRQLLKQSIFKPPKLIFCLYNYFQKIHICSRSVDFRLKHYGRTVVATVRVSWSIWLLCIPLCWYFFRRLERCRWPMIGSDERDDGRQCRR